MVRNEKEITKQLKKLAVTIQTNVNNKWSEICYKRNIPKKICEMFLAYHTVLPTARVQIKTHKHVSSELTNIIPTDLKVRPIVSGCGSPYDKITWLICHILQPLMELVPSHLRNTQDFLNKLQQVPLHKRKGMTFWTADVENLYTNIHVPTAIQNLIDLAANHKEKLNLYGLKLVDIHELLSLTMEISYFKYDSQIYCQLQGFGMGVRPAPLCATARMNNIESSSIYTDLRLSTRLDLRFFVRFYDDIGAMATNKRKAELTCSKMEQQDHTGLLKLTLDFPANREVFTPYLNTENKIDRKGIISSRLYRKEQKKLLTLNASSHHPKNIKEHTITNMYNTAEQVSSCESNKKHSSDMVNVLLHNNGYGARALSSIKEKNINRKKRRKSSMDYVTTLKIPFLTEKCTAEIRKAAKDCNLAIRVVTTPGRKLGDILTASKPLDTLKCPKKDCKCCKALVNGKCTDCGVVYRLTCKVQQCNKRYGGETLRPTYGRFDEHYRTANNPTCKSYKDKSIAQHYAECHPGLTPDFKIEIVEYASTTKLRKVKEARFILKENPELNNKSEQCQLKQFLV